MTQLTNRQTEATARRRPRGFAWELVYLLMMATFFNGAGLAAVAVASGQAAPVQILIGVSIFIMLVALLHLVVRGLCFFAGAEVAHIHTQSNSGQRAHRGPKNMLVRVAGVPTRLKHATGPSPRRGAGFAPRRAE